MVNCGGINEESDSTDAMVYSKSVDGMWAKNSTIKALCKAFPGQVSWKRMPKSRGANYLALTGPLPDLSSWAAAVPKQLRANVSQWKLCDPSE
uniref:Uncharacterized protein MANES_03G070200 n=1 Tax=Rhizophora mucronata TaxID=61149 RepID=A0A2P2JQY8_RHIMU